MNSLLKRPATQIAAALAAATALFATSPALANTTANTSSTAAADVIQPVRDVQGDSLVGGDERFRELFASWSTLDTSEADTPEMPMQGFERPTVSIPSIMPVGAARLSSGFGMRNHPVLRRRRHHHGVDLAAPTGTPVYATADGLVGRADRFSSYGLFISIDHGADIETRYAHLSRLAVAAGERVEKGELIGYVGSTGRSTGPHLHYEVRLDGVAVDPIPYMLETEEQSRLAEGNTNLLPGRRRVGAVGGP